MSIKVMNQVWSRSRNKGSALLLLLAIADHAHDDGGGAYPSIGSLARKTRMGVRSTQLLIQKLITSGELHVEIGAGPKGVNLYRINVEALGGAKIAGVQNLQGRKDCGVQNLRERGAKSGSRGVQHVAPKSSCKEQTMHEPSLQQQQSDDDLPAAANPFDEPHKSIFSFYTVEQFVIEKKPHSTNPGGLARMIWRSGIEDGAIGQWMIEKNNSRKRQEHQERVVSEGDDFDWDKHADDLITRNDLAQLENELEGIEERGGPMFDWEHRILAYFNNRAASEAA